MEWLLFVAAACHLILCPYTKVEESFNLQATHDLLYNGLNISNYDHLEFPGVVPRSFVGPVVLAFLSYPPVTILKLLGLSKFWAQYIVRATLATLVILSVRKFRQSIQKEFGPVTATWFTLITVSQFHFVYYLSRTLPNTFALVLVLLAFHFWMEQRHKMLIVTSAAAMLVFRFELALLLGIVVFIELVEKRMKFLQMFKYGILCGLAMLAITVAMDSYFWKRLVWPEGEVIWFNIILNKSSEWGTSPWAWYFYSAIPRALSSTVFLVPLGIFVDRRVPFFLFPALLFVTLYSFLPHKELRFIIYIFPLLNLAAAQACTYVWNHRLKSMLWVFTTLLVCFHLLVNLFTTVLLLNISYYNYPGGWALAQLHRLEGHRTDVYLHIDIFSAQTGISRFVQSHSHWRYNKTENLTPGSPEMMAYTHLLMEGRSFYSSAVVPYQDTHELLDSISGFSHFKLDYTSFPPMKIRTKPKILILKRRISPMQVVIVDKKFASTSR